MTGSTTGHDSAGRINAMPPVLSERTSTEPAEPEGRRPAAFHNLAPTAYSNRSRKRITANTTILICWLVLLAVSLVVLELHIRSLTRHSSLSRPPLPSEASAYFDSSRGHARCEQDVWELPVLLSTYAS